MYPVFKKYVLWILLPVLFVCCDRSGKNSIVSLRAGMDEFPANAIVTDLAEDTNGFLWIATDGDGLFRFDGSGYLHFFESEQEGNLRSSRIHSVFVASDGLAYVGTDAGLYYLDGADDRFVRCHLDDGTLVVIDLQQDRNGTLYAITHQGVFRKVEGQNLFKKVIPYTESYISGVIIDDRDCVWTLFDHRIERYDENFDLVATMETAWPLIRTTYSGGDRVYVSSFPDVLVLDLSDGALKDAPGKVNDLYRSSQGIFFAAKEGLVFLEDGGFSVYRTDTGETLREQSKGFPFFLPRQVRTVGGFYQMPSGVAWLVPERGRPVRLSNSMQDPNLPLIRFMNEHNVKDVCVTGRFIWFISDYCRLACFDRETGDVKVREIGALVDRLVGEQRDCRLLVDETRDRLLLSLDSNLFDFSIDAKGELHLAHLYPGGLISSYMAMTCDREGNIWTGGTSHSLFHIGYVAADEGPQMIDLERHVIPGVTNQVSVTSVLSMTDGTVAVAFTDLGVALVDGSTFEGKLLDFGVGGIIPKVNAMCEDFSGRLWIGAESEGLIVYDTQTGSTSMPELFRNRRINSISQGSKGRMLLVADNTTLYSYSSVSNQFTPLLNGPLSATGYSSEFFSIDDNPYLFLNGEVYRLASFFNKLDDLMPKGAEVSIHDVDGRLIDYLDWGDLESGRARVTLPSSLNAVKVQVSPFGYYESRHMAVEYVLTGKKQTWEHSLDKPVINLNPLPFGRHRLLLKLMDTAGGEDEALEMGFRIFHQRPWFFSIAAIIVYLVLLLSLLLLIAGFIKEMNRRSVTLEIARKEKDLQERINQDNMDFFTNISHEFRTPLTIVSDATDSLLKSASTNSQQSRLLHAIQRNTYRMLKIVSQILEFNKLEHEKLRLRVSVTDVSRLVRGIAEEFENDSVQKQVSLSINADKALYSWIDEDFFEKIIYNLLSNAFKFTPPGGYIRIELSPAGASEIHELFGQEPAAPGKYLLVHLTDSGIGIPDDRKAEIFERFFQLDASKKQGGTGIGLYFTKALVTAHHGLITVRDNVDGSGNRCGSVFSFALPMDNVAYTEEERESEMDGTESMDSKQYLKGLPSLNIPVIETGQMQKILLIDDDSEILYYLRLMLSPYYKVVCSSDAMTGYKLIEAEHPDLVISDVMMVETDGIQFCKMVKENIEMSHIPVILLTAKTKKDDQIVGLNAGAEAYIVKPFDSDYLLSVIRSILRNREHARKSMGENTSINGDPAISAIPETDRQFLDRLYKFMEEEILDTELDVERLSSELMISRTKFFYKVKNLTGKTPNEFFRTYKLNRAVELIREGKYKLSAISEMVGFSSPSHFATAFKKQFGVLPSKF